MEHDMSNTERNYPQTGIEVLRQLVDRYEAMDAAIHKYHELEKAVWRLRKYIPGDDVLTHIGVIERVEAMLKVDAEDAVRDVIKRSVRT
jgi:hypothetical protein